jgi:drug/metabolite transporter (DMT)-like permease
LTLIGFGMLRLALDASPLSTAAALLSVVSGFEIIFATLTSAQFAVGVLAVITLFIAMAGAYLLLSPSMEETS